MISFYESQSSDRYHSKDWLYFEEQLAKLLIEELSINLVPEKQLEYVRVYQHILAKQVGITDTNLSTYEEIIVSLKGKWKESDYQIMREYLMIPYHLRQNFQSDFIKWCNQLCEDIEIMLQAFNAPSFIFSTIESVLKIKPLQNSENEKLMKEYEFFKGF